MASLNEPRYDLHEALTRNKSIVETMAAQCCDRNNLSIVICAPIRSKLFDFDQT